MDAPCKIQGGIHVCRLVNNMCPGKWVHIIYPKGDIVLIFLYFAKIQLIINNITHYNYTTRRK